MDLTKRLLALAPDIDIFSQKLLVKGCRCQITEAGRTLFASIREAGGAAVKRRTVGLNRKGDLEPRFRRIGLFCVKERGNSSPAVISNSQIPQFGRRHFR
jgi:hypothetical protein